MHQDLAPVDGQLGATLQHSFWPASSADSKFEFAAAREAACHRTVPAGIDIKGWDTLGFHHCGINCLHFSSYRMSNKLVSGKEPMIPCKNSLHNSKVY